MNDAEGRKRMEWLQALRGVAALMVLAFHAHFFLAVKFPPLQPWLAPARWGFSGVEVFFALSGFVVYRSAMRARIAGTLGTFLQHRFLRIYLGYWPAMIVLALSAWLLHEPPFPDGPSILRSVLLIQGALDKHWLAPAWSLELELYFYLVTAGLLFAVPKRPGLVAATALVVLVLWNAGCILLVPELVFTGRQPLPILLSGHAIVFFSGAVVAVACDALDRHGLRMDAAAGVAALAVAALGGAMGVASQAANNSTLRAATFGVMAVGVLVAFIALEGSPWRAPKWLVAIGDASYGLYVLHTTLLTVFFTWVWDARSAFQGLDWLWSLADLSVPGLIVAVSILWFRWVEHPLYMAGLRSTGRRNRTAPVESGEDALAKGPA